MRSPTIRAALALVSLATSLGACARSEPAPTLDLAAPAEIRITLPPPPVGIAACLARPFPVIPDRDLTTGDVVGIVGTAKQLDRAKTACGRRALTWVEAVRRDFAKP